MMKILIPLLPLLLLCSCTAHRKSESNKAFTDTTSVNTERRAVTAREAGIRRAESAELDECAIILNDGTLRIDPDGSLTLTGVKGIKSSHKSSQGETEVKAKEDTEETESSQERRGVSESEEKETEAEGGGVSAGQYLIMLALCLAGVAAAWRLLRGNDK